MTGRSGRRGARRRLGRGRNEEARVRAAEAVSYMRSDGLSLRAASGRARTKPTTVRRHFSSSFHRDPSGRYRVSRSDRQAFRMVVVSEERGVTDAIVRGSQKRHLLGSYHEAVRRYLSPGGGDPTVLAPFAGKNVAGLTLVSDPDALEEIWRQGQLDFLEIYALAG